MPDPTGTVILPTSHGLANYPHGCLTTISKFRTLYISGTSSRLDDGTFAGVQTDHNGTLVIDIREQTKAVLRRIEQVIKHATKNRGGLGDLVDVQIFLVDVKSYYKGMNEVWNEVFPFPSQSPARTTIGVRELPAPEMIVEMKCIAQVEIKDS
ncbi:Endoribonuclease L-PSP/chorismate mutase-like protein [Mariannaea sp. PMI_226]|nr:Endoribonuclease L-PSP/chorismate mutase-like protein [Mariannaea sp. PMI_226]